MAIIDQWLYKNRMVVEKRRADNNHALYQEEKHDHWVTKRERDSAVEESERGWKRHQRDINDLVLAEDRNKSLSKKVVELSSQVEIAKGVEEALRTLLDERQHDELYLSRFKGEISEANVDALTLMKQRAWGLVQLANELLKDRAPK